MADKLQIKSTFDYAGGSTSKTITVGTPSATNSQLKTFQAKIGTFVSKYTLTDLQKIETTSLNDD